MADFPMSARPVQRHDDPGCAYILDWGGDRRTCAAPCRPGSPYCPRHHALCHVASGTTTEARHLREVEVLARVVGGRHARDGTGPSRQFLEKLERIVRAFS